MSLYTLYIQKTMDSQCPYPLTEQLHKFIKLTAAPGIFISPGHLSRGRNINSFLSDFLDSLPDVTLVGLGNRYGYNSIIEHEHWLQTGGSKKKNILLPVSRNNKCDHKKMAFIFRPKENLSTIPTHINSMDEIDGFLNAIEVIGVATGSSNFSYTTYGNTTLCDKVADKGEADILMFVDSEITKPYLGWLNEQISIEDSQNVEDIPLVLSYSQSTVPYRYLERILRQNLISILE